MFCLKQPIKWLGVLALAIGPLLHAGQTPALAGRVELNLNYGWRFERAENQPNEIQPASPEAATAFDDSKWEKVFLPHTPRIEQPENAQNYFQGICWYRRHIAPDPAWRGKKVSLLFEGAMQIADVWVNGQPALTHRGGYLPFSVDITDAVAQPDGAVIAVRLDNTDQPTLHRARNMTSSTSVILAGFTAT